MRFLTPIFFAAAAGWVAWYNAQYTDRAMVLPFVDVLDPAAANDPKRLGELTVYVLAGCAAVLAVWEGVKWARERAAG